jgi:hypothetical protein
VDWVDLEQDRVKRRAVLNLRVQIKVGDLTRPGNVGFSRRAVLHGVSHVISSVPG